MKHILSGLYSQGFQSMNLKYTTNGSPKLNVMNKNLERQYLYGVVESVLVPKWCYLLTLNFQVAQQQLPSSG